MIHYHGCPECYEKYSCDMDCTIELDLADSVCYPEKQFGAYCICNGCNSEKEDKYKTKEFWLRYNGFMIFWQGYRCPCGSGGITSP
jgi:hypothetical protein